MKQKTLKEYTEDYKPSFVDLADTLPKQETIEEHAAYMREYRAKNKERIKAINKKWRAENKEYRQLKKSL